MESKIKEILNEMAEYLSAEQQKKLQQVLIVKLSENRQKPFLQPMKTTKAIFECEKIEGCSERTLIYYGTTLDHFSLSSRNRQGVSQQK